MHSKKNLFVAGVVTILGSEFVLRDILLPQQATGFQVGLAMLAEWLVLVVLIAFWIPRVENLPWASISLGRLEWRHVFWGIIAYLLTTIALMVADFVLMATGLEPLRSLQPRLQAFGMPVLLGLFATGTIVEEIFYRGYLIERLTFLTGHRWSAGVVSWLAFTLVHLKFFGLGPTIEVSIFSAALVLLFLRAKSIWPSVVLHGINNGLAYLIFPLLSLQ